MAAEASAGRSGPRAVGPVPAGVAGRGGPAPVLLDGSAEGRLLPHLIDRLRDPDLDRIDMAVSFVMKSGLSRILRALGGRAGLGEPASAFSRRTTWRSPTPTP